MRISQNSVWAKPLSTAIVGEGREARLVAATKIAEEAARRPGAPVQGPTSAIARSKTPNGIRIRGTNDQTPGHSNGNHRERGKGRVKGGPKRSLPLRKSPLASSSRPLPPPKEPEPDSEVEEGWDKAKSRRKVKAQKKAAKVYAEWKAKEEARISGGNSGLPLANGRPRRRRDGRERREEAEAEAKSPEPQNAWSADEKLTPTAPTASHKPRTKKDFQIQPGDKVVEFPLLRETEKSYAEKNCPFWLSSEKKGWIKMPERCLNIFTILRHVYMQYSLDRIKLKPALEELVGEKRVSEESIAQVNPDAPKFMWADDEI